MVETLQSLQLELARLRKLINELEAVGLTGFASALQESVDKLVGDIAKLTGTAPEQLAGQQQPRQPKE